MKTAIVIGALLALFLAGDFALNDGKTSLAIQTSFMRMMTKPVGG